MEGQSLAPNNHARWFAQPVTPAMEGSNASAPNRHLHSRTTYIIKNKLNLKNKDQVVCEFSQKPFLWEHSLYDVCIPDYLPSRPMASEDRTTLYAFILSQPSTLTDTHKELKGKEVGYFPTLGIGPALREYAPPSAQRGPGWLILSPLEESSIYPSQHPHSWSTRSAKSEDGSLSRLP